MNTSVRNRNGKVCRNFRSKTDSAGIRTEWLFHRKLRSEIGKNFSIGNRKQIFSDFVPWWILCFSGTDYILVIWYVVTCMFHMWSLFWSGSYWGNPWGHSLLRGRKWERHLPGRYIKSDNKLIMIKRATLAEHWYAVSTHLPKRSGKLIVADTICRGLRHLAEDAAEKESREYTRTSWIQVSQL